jgi:hypothetical protein
MAHFAQLNDDNFVINVIVVSNDYAPDPSPENSEQRGIEFIEELSKNNESLKGRWVQTSYNSSFRNKYAAIGDVYNEEFDVFIAPRPYPSWILDTDSYAWESPVPRPPKPEEPYRWRWNEDIENWEKYQPSEQD